MFYIFKTSEIKNQDSFSE